MCKLLEMRKMRTTAYHPQGKSQIENFHHTLKALLKTQLEEVHDRWDEHLDFCLMAYRSSIHSSTGYSPYRVMFGREITVPLDVMMADEETEEEEERIQYGEFTAN